MARLLDVLREEMHLTGTKEGCGEGECGACAVLMNGAIVNSCLVPAIEADGAEIRTIEGIACGEQLERRAGSVSRMWRRAMRHLHARHGDRRGGAAASGILIPTDAEIREGLAGNLCRCTGYQKIFAAVVRACESPSEKRSGEPMRAYIPAYDLRVPGSLSEALALLAREPGVWQPFAGGTDLMVLLEAGKLSHKRFLSLAKLDGFARNRSDRRCRDPGRADDVHGNPETSRAAGGISAAVRGGARNRQHRHAESRHAGRKYRERFARGRFPARAAGLRRGNRTRFRARRALAAVPRLPHRLQKDAARVRTNCCARIRLPRRAKPWRQYYRKVGTRKAQAISKVCFAGAALDGRRHDSRHSHRAGQRRSHRAARGENGGCAARRAASRPQAIAAAKETLAREIAPIDDIRSTARYRLRVAQNLLEEFLSQLAK